MTIDTVLPPSAAEKMTILEDARSEAESLSRAANDRLKQLTEQTPKAERNAAFEARAKKLQESRDRHRVVFEDLTMLVTRLKEFVRALPDNAHLESVTVAGKIRPELTLFETVEAIRHEIAAIEIEQAQVKSLPLTLDDLKKAARAYVYDLAEQAKPRIFADRSISMSIDHMEDFGVRGNHLVGLILYLCGTDHLVARLDDHLERTFRAEAGISDKDRHHKLLSLEAKLASLSYQEESLIETAAQSGHEIVRRPRALCEAVLMVKVTNAKISAVRQENAVTAAA